MYGGYPQPAPPPYTMLNGPQYYPPPRRKSSDNCATACCRCICCFSLFFIILFIIQLLTVLYFYVSYDPKAPSYHLEAIQVKMFDLRPDTTLTTNIHVAIRAENPNKHMEFVYGPDSVLAVEYETIGICAGRLPAFRQGRENATLVETELTGVSVFGPVLQRGFLEHQKNRTVPVMVRMRVPINVILGETTLREFKVFVDCKVVVDGLTPGNATRIISKETVAFHVEVGS